MATPDIKPPEPLNLYYVPEFLHEQARVAFEQRNAVGILCSTANSSTSLDLLFDNVRQFKAAGILEAGILDAITATRGNNHRHPMTDLRWLFAQADLSKLRELAPLPGPGPFVLYRGVAGKPKYRRVRGLSWTSNRERAEWFATRMLFPEPAVYVAIVPADYIMAYSNERKEHEFFVLLPPSIVPRQVGLLGVR